MKVSTKLYGALGALALIGVLVACAGIGYVSALGEELSVATGKTAMKLDLVNAARARSWEMVAALLAMSSHATMHNQPEMEDSAKRWDAGFQRAGEQIIQIRPLLVTPQSREAIARFESGLAEFEKVASKYKLACREGKPDDAAALLPRVQAFAAVAEETLNFVKETNRKFLADSQERAASLGAQSLFVNVLLACALLGIVGAASYVVRGVNRALATALSELAQGADQLTAAANQVSTSSQSLAQGSSEQAAALEETSASTEEINSMARKNSENSEAAAILVDSSQQRFVQTNQSLEQTVVAMDEINAQSGRISKIIKTIDEIAFQTNILALNAAVEAARAGEAGMGFAVVADEVRNLAQRCAQAAKDTASLIEESVRKSSTGKTKVDEVAASIRSMTDEAARVKTLVDEVNLASKEQAGGIAQIGKAITQMEHITQTSAAGAQQSASAAQQLNAQSETLRDIVSRLHSMVGGGAKATGDPARPGPAAGAPAAPRKPAFRLPATHASRTAKVYHAAPPPPEAGRGSDPFPMDGEFESF
jgi:methyl-accepting chemotaxis protein